MRNSILLISHYEELITKEHKPWKAATEFLGATERLLPIVMTALVVALGLVTSTILNLLVLPILATRFARFERA